MSSCESSTPGAPHSIRGPLWGSPVFIGAPQGLGQSCLAFTSSGPPRPPRAGGSALPLLLPTARVPCPRQARTRSSRRRCTWGDRVSCLSIRGTPLTDVCRAAGPCQALLCSALRVAWWTARRTSPLGGDGQETNKQVDEALRKPGRLTCWGAQAGGNLGSRGPDGLKRGAGKPDQAVVRIPEGVCSKAPCAHLYADVRPTGAGPSGQDKAMTVGGRGQVSRGLSQPVGKEGLTRCPPKSPK